MSDRATIRQELLAIVQDDTGETFDNLDDAKNLRQELGLDSVDVVSIVSQVERKFRIRMTQQELEKLVTVGDLLDLMQAKLDAPPATEQAA